MKCCQTCRQIEDIEAIALYLMLKLGATKADVTKATERNEMPGKKKEDCGDCGWIVPSRKL